MSPWGAVVSESRRKEDPTDTEWLSPGFLSRPSYHWWPQDQYCRGWVMPNGNPSRVGRHGRSKILLPPTLSPPSLSLLSRKWRAIGHVEPVVFHATHTHTRVKILYARSTIWRLCRDRRARNRSSIAHRSMPSHSWRWIRGRELNESYGSEHSRSRFKERERLVKVHRSPLDRFIPGGRATESSCRARRDVYHRRGDWPYCKQRRMQLYKYIHIKI